VVVASTLVVTLQPAENHFLEVQAVETVYDARVAEALGLRPGVIGSVALGLARSRET
jgi:RNA-splicing ligase RtcB